MAQLVKPDIQSNPIGETSPNDFFNVETTQQNNFFNTESDRTNIEDPNQNVSTNDIPPLNAPNLNELIPPFLDGNPTEVYNFNENSLINGEYVPLDSDKEVRDALPSLDLNDFNFNAFDQLQVNDQLQNITESISRLHKSSKPSNQSVYSKPTSGNDYYEKSSSIHTQRVNPPQYNDTQRVNLPPIKTTNSRDDIPQINGKLQRRNTVNSTTTKPYFIWDGSFEYFNCKKLSKKPNYKWNIENEKDEILKFFSNYPNFSKRNIQIYNVCDDPLIAFVASKSGDFKDAWKKMYSRNSEFKNYVDKHNEQVFKYFEETSEPNIREIYKEKISKYSSNENCNNNNELINLNDEEKECINKFSDKENYLKFVISTNPCKVKYVNINNPDDYFEEEEKENNTNNPIPRNVFTDNKGTVNKGTVNKGTINKGSDNEFTYVGTDNEVTDNEGTDNEVTDDESSDNEVTDDEEYNINYPILRNNFTYVDRDNKGTDDEDTNDEDTGDENTDDESTDNEEQSIIYPPSSRINLYRDITLENEPIKLIKKKNIIKPNNKHQPVNIGKENPVKPDNTIIPKSKPVKLVKLVKPVNKPVKLDINTVSESDKIISPDKKHSSVNKSVKLDINTVSKSDKIISPEKSSKFTPVSSVKPQKKIAFNSNNVMPIKRVAKKYKTINPDGTIGNLLKDDQKCIDKYEIIRQFLIDTDTHIVKNRKSSK